MRYQFFQLKREMVHEFGYISMDEVISMGKRVSCFNYNLVYEGKIDRVYPTEPHEYVLERLFRKFNLERPEDFTGASMSESDVILLEGYGAFYVDCYGFKEVKDWGK